MKNFALFFFSTLLLFLFSCNNDKKTVSENSPVSAEKKKADNSGVNIAYDDNGSGDTTLLFIHGWGINKSYWADQTVFFSKKYRVVAVDLAGFGQSGKNRNNWTTEEFGKDVSAVIGALDLKNIILIGHSMSGAIAVETALTNPSRVLGVIGIDNFKSYGDSISASDREAMAKVYASMRSNFADVVTGYVNEGLFSPSTDSAVRKRVLQDILSGDSVIAVNAIEQGDNYPLDKKILELKKTIYAVNSDFSHNDVASFKKGKIPYVLFNIGPTGHYPMIEKPNEFNLLLEKAIEQMIK